MIKPLRALLGRDEPREERWAPPDVVAVKFAWDGGCFVQISIHAAQVPRVGDAVRLELGMLSHLEGTAARVTWRFRDDEPRWEYLQDGDVSL